VRGVATNGARRCCAADVPAVVDLLVKAFDQDPTWSWVFPDPQQRAQQQGLLWRALVDGAMRLDSVWQNEAETAASVWIPPGCDELSEEQDAALTRDLEAMLGDEAPRVLRVLAAFDAAHPHDGEAHWTLSLLGTLPSATGHGHGLQLLADNLADIDEADLPCYLEASNPVNVDLYARYGFERFGSFTLPDGGHDVATMWRPRRTDRR
jgi:ribosomal protein S18 acetylase RimI-like enzyme